MKTKKISFFIALLLLLSLACHGQKKDFIYQRELYGVNAAWNKIILPEDIYSRLSSTLSDIRIIAVDAKSDTLELPYLFVQRQDRREEKELKMELLNVSKNAEGYFFTFELPVEDVVDEISLDFKEQNFDWRINLEASHDQTEWFTLLENYRILSIHNELTQFSFTDVKCPKSKFRFFRLFVKSSVRPHLNDAKIKQIEIVEGDKRIYNLSITKVRNDKKNKLSEINLELPLPVIVNSIRINVLDSFDYYRPVRIKYLSDSIHTENGWKYNYRTLRTANLNSLENNEFDCDARLAQKLKIIINNNDNQALSIASVQVKSYKHELQARFNRASRYYLLYGNPKAEKPNYDIAHFAEKIPNNLNLLQLGEEQLVQDNGGVRQKKSIFNKEFWLWSVLLLVALSLGISSVRMMRKK